MVSWYLGSKTAEAFDRRRRMAKTELVSSPVAARRSLAAAPSVALAAAAACTAALYSNAAETIKTRLQLDLEGTARGQAQRAYKGVVDAAVKIYRTEGVGLHGRGGGLHAGLTAALAYQATMNGLRVGLYEPTQRNVRRFLSHDDSRAGSSASDILIRAASGAMSGALGASIASPLYLVKNRLQAESPFFQAKERHGYTGMVDGLTRIWRAEGIRGLFRGVNGAVPRVMVGSATQLTTFDLTLAWLRNVGGTSDGSSGNARASLGRWSSTFVASVTSAAATVMFMSPFDVVSTRIYQSSGHATKYSGLLDCAAQTLRAEGIFAFWKGATAQFVRLGPHTMLTFMALEWLRPAFLAVDAFVAESG